MKLIHYAALYLAISLLFSCSNENIAFKKGEQAYAVGEYYNAASYYKLSYSRCSPKKDKVKRSLRAYKMGDCYRRINLVQKATSAYQNAIRYGAADSTAYLYLGQQYLKLSNYKSAEECFKKYLEI